MILLRVVQQKMPNNMDSRSETQVKIDYAGTALEVLNLKGHKIAQKISSLHFMNLYFWKFLVGKTLNCYIIETVRAFYLILTLRNRPKYQQSCS